MKRIAIVLSSAAWVLSAQAQATQPAPAAAPDAVAKPVAYRIVEPRVVTDYPVPSKVDPRVCLEFPNPTQVIACANKYLPAKRRS